MFVWQLEFRHYFIRAKAVGMTKQVKRLIKKPTALDFSHLEDISEMLDPDDDAGTAWIISSTSFRVQGMLRATPRQKTTLRAM